MYTLGEKERMLLEIMVQQPAALMEELKEEDLEEVEEVEPTLELMERLIITG